ncbi:MAG: endopeptidase La [Acidobacteria bacterium 13_1_20CM_2_60_10]|nr:MAG: endopeptidase La [Acidobacteria bacterium 13_1_20CM_2_60_10]
MPTKQKKSIEFSELPILPVRDTVLFPHSILPLTVGRESSLKLINDLKDEDKFIAVVAQRDPRVDNPQPVDLYQIGTAAFVHKIIRLPSQSLFIFVEGLQRIAVQEVIRLEPYMYARVKPLQDATPTEKRADFEALVRNVSTLFQQVIQLSPTLSDDLQTVVMNIDDPGRLADFISANLPSLSSTEKQELLESLELESRLERLNSQLAREVEVLQLRSKIQSDVQDQVSQSQREYYLREQMKAIQKELGEADEQQEIEELRKKIEASGMTEEARKEALRELSRLSKMSPAAADYHVTRTYLDWLVALPWNKVGDFKVNLPKAKAALDEDHYDLEKVKERILDYLAVLQLKPQMKGPILCFVGPPGVGKTSLGKSIARALDRKFVRMSLGGIHDEAEIRGHRRTYIGALPGQIIQGIRRAETRDPVFMLDEVDKIGRDFRGDPSSALLEVLDPEQNSHFRDNYLDVQFDLSRVLFICTSNMLDTVPPPLLDRMELLELQGYTEEEKIQIAFRHLIPKQTDEHGVKSPDQIEFTPDALASCIRNYTREAGVRSLEREIATLCRKQARKIAEGATQKLVVTPDNLADYLGIQRFRLETEIVERTRQPGVAVGLAWTPSGGDVLFVEANIMKGGKGFTMTGQLGQVMQESMQAALAWVRSHSEEYAIDPDFFQAKDIHIHVPAGAIPKDGPSAGVTMVTALVSSLTRRPLRERVAMTGEITLSGLVLPVGGIKEKVLAAKRAGVREVILPADNQPNVHEDLTHELLEGLVLHYVKTIREAVDSALEKDPVKAGVATGLPLRPAPVGPVN